MTPCERIQRALTKAGPRALRQDAAGIAHLTECDDCLSFLQALLRVDGVLAGTATPDASTRSMRAALARVAAVMSAAAAPTVAVSAAVVKPPARLLPTRAALKKAGQMTFRPACWLGQALARVRAAIERRGLLRLRILLPLGGALALGLLALLVLDTTRLEGGASLALWQDKEAFAELRTTAGAPALPSVDAPQQEAKKAPAHRAQAGDRLRVDAPPKPEPIAAEERKAKVSARFSKLFANDGSGSASIFGGGGGGASRTLQEVIGTAPVSGTSGGMPGLGVHGAPDRERRRDDATTAVSGKDTPPLSVSRDIAGIGTSGRLGGAGLAYGRSGGLARHKEKETIMPATIPVTGALSTEVIRKVSPVGDADPVPAGPAADFIAERENTQQLTFKEPSGYWDNTYVPGDPAMRLLQTRLASSSRSSLFGSPTLRLDDAARQCAQPFDVPESAALGVYLQADTRTLQEEGRVLVEVGLKGTPRHSGSRPAMNVAMVLDARGTLASEAGVVMRALATALGRAKSAGDRFALVLAGRPGGVVVSPSDFRAGPITVALQQALGEAEPVPGPTLSLAEAMTAAAGLVLASDDPNAPLGSSAVIFVTSQALGSQITAMRDVARESAVNGVPTSVVGIGAGVRGFELDDLTLAGQGNRRLCESVLDADGVVTRELLASSRIVARAVRLRIRLAPGVKLVDVIGSHRLDEEQTEAVRRAEKSVDRRLARALGLASDRGEDEDGIQVVVPSFYAGDTHAILLDVVAPGPGPVAEVRVRYKDLVFMRNGVARSQLSLARGPKAAGPLELSVRKSLLARRVHDTLRRAGDALSSGDSSSAIRELAAAQGLLDGIRRSVPAWTSDPDLRTDLGMVLEYRTLLQQADGFSGNQRDYVADSLRYAGYLKVLPRAARDPGAQSSSGE